MNPFINPWLLLPKDKLVHTTMDYSLEVKSRIHAAFPKKGVMQTCVAILLTKFADELQRQGLVDFNDDAFKKALCDCTIQLGGYNYEKENHKDGVSSGNRVSRLHRARTKGNSR